MGNFLKIGNSRQAYETQKAIGQAGAFDVNSGELVEVTIAGAASGTTSHRIASPQGAILIDSALDVPVGVVQTVSANSLSVALTGAATGTLSFLVF